MSDLVPPRVRRNNLVTLALLILFAIGLCVFVLISMRIHAQRRAANPEATGSIRFGVRRHVAALSEGDMSPLPSVRPGATKLARHVALGESGDTSPHSKMSPVQSSLSSVA